MESTYAGIYGKLQTMKIDSLNEHFISQLKEKNVEDFLNLLSSTTYRNEIDKLSGIYKNPDLAESVINAHMVSTINKVSAVIPPSAKEFINAYLSKWDIENIKIVLSSKVLGYDLSHTESFLIVEDTPVGTLSGTLTKYDFVNMIEQKNIEDVVNYLMKYNYGKILLPYVEDAKKSGEISEIISVLDLYYYNNLLDKFKLYNINRLHLFKYIKESIDVSNILNLIKTMELGYNYDDIKKYVIKGGNISEETLIAMSKKNVYSLKEDIPFEIGYAFDLYKKDQLITYFETALNKELYGRYIKLFKSMPISIEFIMSFILSAELERRVVRGIWYSKYYGISKERADKSFFTSMVLR